MEAIGNLRLSNWTSLEKPIKSNNNNHPEINHTHKPLDLKLQKNTSPINKIAYEKLSEANFYQWNSERLMLLELPRKTHSYCLYHLFGNHRSSLDGLTICLWSPDGHNYHFMEKCESYDNSRFAISFNAHNASNEHPNSLCYINFQKNQAEISSVQDLNYHSDILKIFHLYQPINQIPAHEIFINDLLDKKIQLIPTPNISIPFRLFQMKNTSEVLYIELQKKIERTAVGAFDKIHEQWRVHIKKSEKSPWIELPIEYAQRVGNSSTNNEPFDFFAKFKKNEYQTLFLTLPRLNKTYDDNTTESYIIINNQIKYLDPIDCSPEMLDEYGFTYTHSVRPTPLDTIDNK
ncbi:MAG: hypothetical protein Q8K60_08850 [Parachlamydiaceae bacterium]|nr:hypothetical protein [Parachlamydiaceae bacterium]